MTFWQVFLMLMIFVPLIMLWVFTLVDLFQRADLSGIAKALWAIAIVLLPLIGMLVYFLLREPTAPAVGDRPTSTPVEPSDPAVSPPGAADVADQLERLADLRDKSILTDDEFQREKDKLLGSGPE
ncbi:MAG: SHOCT domain-containing protein [Actinomycetota bacterium]|nr:SHOCT domain-containing protein [Actinomycetota bacterium]